MPTPVLLVVNNQLATDQRLHKMCLSLSQLGYMPELLGVGLAAAPQRPYPTAQLPLLASRGPLRYLELNLRLLWQVWRHPSRIICANDLDTLPGCWLACRLARKALVYDSHEYYTGQAELLVRPRVRRVWQWLERKLLPRVAQRLTVNNSVAARYAADYGTAMTVIYNYPLLQPAPATLPQPSSGILLYQGSVQQGRGLELMVAAMQYLTGLRLWVVGDGYHMPALRQAVRYYRVADRVRLWGQVALEQLPQITAQASLGLSLEDTDVPNSALASPNKVFDYIHAGLPFIASNLPEVVQVIDQYDCGLLLQARNPEALAQLVQHALANHALYNDLQQGCLRAAQQLYWEQQLPAIEQIYAKAAAELMQQNTPAPPAPRAATADTAPV